ncbi:hypothetical protein CY34DRAFT_798569 [Suillus luteus UH-Slu-Lm8-n1]|uniref:Uncharacterized protein n=1 Tax=Suillus luteus UH-Slu-Lm8-n1 TaxID=930992 RepID=A0A0D0BEF9_9AGAM|nr:hypothetical protein CY34DRAFT_798569 [Suillus luteus UH-Slu-Lm8-n1]
MNARNFIRKGPSFFCDFTSHPNRLPQNALQSSKPDRAKEIAATAVSRLICLAPDGTRTILSAATWKPTSASTPPGNSPPDVKEEIKSMRDLEGVLFLVWALNCLTIQHLEPVRCHKTSSSHRLYPGCCLPSLKYVM